MSSQVVDIVVKLYLSVNYDNNSFIYQSALSSTPIFFTTNNFAFKWTTTTVCSSMLSSYDLRSIIGK